MYVACAIGLSYCNKLKKKKGQSKIRRETEKKIPFLESLQVSKSRKHNDARVIIIITINIIIINNNNDKDKCVENIINGKTIGYREMDRLVRNKQKDCRTRKGRGVLWKDDVRGTSQDDRYIRICLLYTSPSPRDMRRSRMPSSA